MKCSLAITLRICFGLVGSVLAMGTLQAMTELFDAVEATISNRGLGVEYAGRSLGIEFRRSQAKSNDFFDVVTAGRSRRFPELKSAEIRLDRRSENIRFVLIDIDASVDCIPDGEILRRFGSSPELGLPTPRQPPKSPVYYIYHHPWGDLRIGVSQGKQRCVETIVAEFND